MSGATRTLADRRVFLDSSGLLALTNRNDAYHREAVAIWARLIRERWATMTTNFVIAETHALFLARLGQSDATAFLRGIAQSSTETIRAGQRDEERARAIIFQYTDKDFSLTDAISFAVMERLGLTSALTFDRHFAQYGLAALTSD